MCLWGLHALILKRRHPESREQKTPQRPNDEFAVWAYSALIYFSKMHSSKKSKPLWSCVNCEPKRYFLVLRERQGQRKGIGDPNKLFCTLNYYKLENISPKNYSLLKKYILKIQMSLFLGANLDKFSILSLAHQWIICSEWVPSEWESHSCVFVRRKSTIWCFNFKLYHLWRKYHYS